MHKYQPLLPSRTNLDVDGDFFYFSYFHFLSLSHFSLLSSCLDATKLSNTPQKSSLTNTRLSLPLPLSLYLYFYFCALNPSFLIIDLDRPSALGMDEDKGNKVDRGVDDFATDSSWALGGGGDSDGVYFFGGGGVEKDESNILSDFGWSFQEEEEHGGGFSSRIDSDLAGNSSNDRFSVLESATTAAATPSDATEPVAVQAEQTSSSSSDDAPEKSTASGGSTSRQPADTA